MPTGVFARRKYRKTPHRWGTVVKNQYVKPYPFLPVVIRATDAMRTAMPRTTTQEEYDDQIELHGALLIMYARIKNLEKEILSLKKGVRHANEKSST